MREIIYGWMHIPCYFFFSPFGPSLVLACLDGTLDLGHQVLLGLLVLWGRQGLIRVWRGHCGWCRCGGHRRWRRGLFLKEGEVEDGRARHGDMNNRGRLFGRHRRRRCGGCLFAVTAAAAAVLGNGRRRMVVVFGRRRGDDNGGVLGRSRGHIVLCGRQWRWCFVRSDGRGCLNNKGVLAGRRDWLNRVFFGSLWLDFLGGLKGRRARCRHDHVLVGLLGGRERSHDRVQRDAPANCRRNNRHILRVSRRLLVVGLIHKISNNAQKGRNLGIPR